MKTNNTTNVNTNETKADLLAREMFLNTAITCEQTNLDNAASRNAPAWVIGRYLDTIRSYRDELASVERRLGNLA